MNIGIIGQGFVGNAVYQKFSKYFDVKTYDIDNSKCNSNFEELLTYSEIIFLCLPTPMNPDGSCNTGIVEKLLEKINKSEKNKIVVIKSTIPPGTTEKYNEHYKNISIVFNPEFLTERNAVEDYENQNRIILGGPRPSTTILKQLFSVAFSSSHIIKTGSTHAEFIKYFTNCFLQQRFRFQTKCMN